MEQCFIVDFEPAGDCQRADGLLGFPALGQEHEAFYEIGAFDNLDDPICGCPHGLYEKRLVAAIDTTVSIRRKRRTSGLTSGMPLF
jgi:hypothetical protein